MIALVRPAVIAIGSQAAPRVCRSGMPNDVLDAPQVMLTPNSSRIRRIVSQVTSDVVVSAPIGIASGSITMSAWAMPYSCGRDPDDLGRQVEPLVGLHRDLVVVVGQRDDRGVVLLDQREDRGEPVVLGGDRVDQRAALVDRQPGLERLDDRGVDADRHVGEALHQLDRPGEQVGLVGERDAHVDVEHVGAALDLGLHVALDRGQVAGAQLLLEDPAAGRVDPLADQAEAPAVADDDVAAGAAEDGLERLGGVMPGPSSASRGAGPWPS